MQRARVAGTGRAGSGLVTAALTALVAASYARLYFGVDLTDEAFYVALPYRFANGARPLVDEALLVQQSSAVLLYPFVKAYTGVAGTKGIVLFARHLHFLFVCGVWTAITMSVRSSLPSRYHALVAGALAVTFVPFGIPALSYNTFAEGFFAAGSFLAFAGSASKDRRLLVTAGACVGLGVFAYPPIAVGALALVAGVGLRQRRGVRGVVALAAPILLIGAFALAFFLSDGFGRAIDLVHQSRLYGNQGGGVGKLGTVCLDVVDGFPYKVAAFGLLLAAAGLRKWTKFGWMPLLLLPFTAVPADLRTSASANVFVTNLGLLAIGLVVLEHRRRGAIEIFGLVWLPSAVAGVMTAISSSNGAINLAIGFLPGAVVTLVLLDSAIRSCRAGSPTAADGDAVATVALLGTLAITVVLQYASVYRDSGIRSLDTRVTDGPYAGLYTTPAKNRFLTRLDSDLRRASGRRCSILFYDTFPAGYLFAHGTSDTNNTWFLNPERGRSSYDSLLVEYFRQRGGLPDVVVRLARVPLATGEATVLTYPESDPLERLFATGRYARALSRPDYVIERRRGSACLPARE